MMHKRRTPPPIAVGHGGARNERIPFRGRASSPGDVDLTHRFAEIDLDADTWHFSDLSL